MKSSGREQSQNATLRTLRNHFQELILQIGKLRPQGDNNLPKVTQKVQSHEENPAFLTPSLTLSFTMKEQCLLHKGSL